MPAKTGDIVDCPEQIVLGQMLNKAFKGSVVAVEQWQNSKASKQINVVQDKKGRRSIYFDTDCIPAGDDQ